MIDQTNRDTGQQPQEPHDEVPPCPRCGFHGVNKNYCEVCGYLLMPMSPDISPRLRKSISRIWFVPWLRDLDLIERWEHRMRWRNRIDYLDSDYEMPKATRTQVLIVIIVITLALLYVIFFRNQYFPR
jgi:ribosomal protein L37E